MMGFLSVCIILGSVYSTNYAVYAQPIAFPPPPPPGPATPALTCSPSNSLIICSALTDLYTAIGGISSFWTDESASIWASSILGNATDYCTLPYITCDLGSVKSLAFQSLQADNASEAPAGVVELPASIGDLTSLTSLLIVDAGLNISGGIPASWASLTSLTNLVLFGNCLTAAGALPDWLGTMTALETLSLGQVVYPNATSGCGFTGAIPSSFNSLVNLHQMCAQRH